MKNQILLFFKQFIPFTVILYLIQFFILKIIGNSSLFYYSLSAIYTFHVISTSIICLLLIYISRRVFDKTGFAFMVLSVLKMLAAILFLIPLIQLEKENKIADIIDFFAPYFSFLAFEMIFIIKLLNKNYK